MPFDRKTTFDSKTAEQTRPGSAGTSASGKSADIAAEQAYVSTLYDRLDAERELVERRLTEACAARGNTAGRGGT